MMVLYTEHVKEPGRRLSSSSCILALSPETTKHLRGVGIGQMGNQYDK